ncbi:hypothetical protein AB0F18_01630 [Streptomyces sp. NPDC029216]|uniref:hypothetical protein n=1 Tax=Streptomyces sp. NPDC029216 TaxID=3154701 RepID=UPI0033F3CC25
MRYLVYLAVPIGLAALLLAASGIATLTRGWLLPRQRRHIVRPRLFGWAQLIMAASLGVQLLGLPAVDAAYRPAVNLPGTVVLLFSLVLVTRAQRPSPARHTG